jgi:hypothetical protein
MWRRPEAALLALALLGCGRVVEREQVDASSADGSSPASAIVAASGGEGAGVATDVAATATGGDGGGPGGAAPDGGGDPGSGGRAPTRHVVELDLSPAELSPATTMVQINDPDGGLVWRVPGDVLPLEVEVEDGQVVSFIRGSVQSFRVTTDVERITGQGAEPHPPQREPGDEPPAPMHLSIEVPPVADGLWIDVQVRGGIPHLYLAAPAVVAVDARGVDGIVDVLATARNEDEVPTYQHVQVAYEPGQSGSVQLEITDTVRRPVVFDLSSLDGADTVGSSTGWHGGLDGGLQVHEWALQLHEEDPTGALVYAPAIAPTDFGFPVVYLQVNYPTQSDSCTRAALFHEGWRDAPIAFDARGLRPPRLDSEARWGWVSEGALADLVAITWVAPQEKPPFHEPRSEAVTWVMTEDPRDATWPILFPDIPDDPDDAFEPPAQPVAFTRIEHTDHERVDGYAAWVARPVPTFPQTRREWVVERCP